jgi:hypothetical protein
VLDGLLGSVFCVLACATEEVVLLVLVCEVERALVDAAAVGKERTTSEIAAEEVSAAGD